MIPSENDNSIKKTLVVTRGKNKESSVSKNINSKFHSESDQLHMWDCTSINDIKHACKLKFVLEKRPKEDIYKYITENDKSNNEMRIRCSDNPKCLGTLLEKLSSYLKRSKNEKFAIARDDAIFSMIPAEEFKARYNNLNKSNEDDVRIMLYNKPQKILDENRKNELIRIYHNTPQGGHFGVRKTTLKLKQKYSWKNMSKMVKEYVTKCDLCQRNKRIRHTKEPFEITNTPSHSFDTIVIDTVGPLRPTNNFRYILTMQCELTKYLIACPMETKEAKSIAKALVENVILKYGSFNILKSDRGTEFTNELMKEICELLKIEQRFSTPYHHETLGTVERNHRVLNEYFLSFVESDDWDKWIPYYAFAYNITPHVDTEYSPFELIFGRLPCLPGDEVMNHPKVYNFDNYANELKTRLKYSLDYAKKLTEKAKKNRQLESNNKANSINLEIGDLVLVRIENRRKSEAPYKGPYNIVGINGMNVSIKIGNNIKTYHKNLLKKYNS